MNHHSPLRISIHEYGARTHQRAPHDQRTWNEPEGNLSAQVRVLVSNGRAVTKEGEKLLKEFKRRPN